jgi:hypothetical protein
MSLTQQDFESCAAVIGCEPAAVHAVATVETNGGGFNPDGSPRTLFEGQWFHKLTGGKYDTLYPTISYPTWTRQIYGKTWQEEQARLAKAKSLDPHVALQCASWGMFQIMGFNYAKCGFASVEDYVAAMSKSEGAQLAAFTQYIVHSGLADELRDKRWADFARLYNGPQYAQNQYDTKLATAYTKALNG